MMVRLAVSVLAIGMAVGSASAQSPAAAPPKQTAENAQVFLTIALKDRQIYDRRFRIAPGKVLLNERMGCSRLPSGGCWNGTYSASAIATAENRARTSTVLEVASDNICVTRILHRTQGAEVVQEYYPPYDSGTHYSRQEFNRQPQEVMTLDWSKVSSARADGGSLMLTTSQKLTGLIYGMPDSNDPVVELRFADSDLATRAAYAAEVIRMRCDPLSNTGF